MKVKYLLGFFIAMGATQLFFAAEFKIVEFTAGAKRTAKGIEATGKGIDKIALIYRKDYKEGPYGISKYFETEKITYHRKLKNGDRVENTGWGIKGSTGMLQVFKGVAFQVGDSTYIGKFTTELSSLAVNILVEIYYINNSYVGYLYPDRFVSSKSESIGFIKQ